MKLIPFAIVLAGVFASVSAVCASDLQKFFGHEIKIEEEGYEKKLTVDGRELHKDAIVSLNEIVLIGTTPVLIGDSSNGGNACDAAPFVISFPPAANVRFDGPLETCYSTHYRVLPDGIEFSTNSIPAKGTYRWKWTLDQGFEELPTDAFKPDSSLGWTALRERQMDNSALLFGNGEIAVALQQLLGSDFPAFQRILTGTGGGEFKGDDYVGMSCTPHSCGSEEALVFLSARERKVYAAWKPEGGKIIVRPAVKEWPAKARLPLRDWAAKWK